MRKIILSMIMLPLCITQLYAPPIKYASPTSTLKCSGKSKIKANSMKVSIGTLSQGANAILEGVNYTFDSKATFAQDGGCNITGSLALNADTDTIFCDDGQQATSNAGSTVKQTLAFAGANCLLEGLATNFLNPNTIVLANNATTFDVALTSPLSTSIAFNGGTVKLIQDLKVSGSATFFGDGTVDFNIRSLIFDGNPRSIGGKILLEQASDFIFNGRLTVTGELTFSGDSVMIGNGNILDISQGGTIRIKRDTTVDFVNAKLKGLGIGQIILEYPTSALRLSNIEIEMNRDYTFTIGGILAEGPTTIATKNHFLTFDQAGSLTIDGISLWNDPLIFQPMNNIQGNITSLNDGLIRDVVSSDLVNANSNTLLFLNRNNSNTLLFLDRTDSAAKLFLTRNNSNALLFGDRNNSNALLFISRTISNAIAQGIRHNSNTLLFLDRTDSAAKLFLTRNNSNTLLFLNRTSSNADARGIRNNSNTLLFLDRTDSAAKLFLTRNNSNTLLFLNRTSSNADARGIRNNSNTLLFLDRTDSAAKLFLARNNSNTLLFLNRNNSNAILDLTRSNSQALIELALNNSNTILFFNRNLSNTILFLDRTDSAAKLFLTRNNSNALLFGDRNNSNTQLFLDRTDSAAKLFLTRNNSNTLLFLNRNLSNALIRLTQSNSQALVELALNNSNTILFFNRNLSNTILFLERNDSNAKLFLTRNNSNTLLFLNRNNSNAIIALKNALIFGCQSIAGKLDLFHCLCFGPGDCINVVGDACIDGHGVEIAFTDQPFAQFKVHSGVNVVLKNITFSGINQNTFGLDENSSIQIGENVIWELDTDVTFSASAVIEVLDGTDGCTPITGPCNVFKIRGETCRRAFDIKPLDDELVNGQPRRSFILGHNTVMLESAQISGFDHMSFFNDDTCAAAVALACNAAADIDSQFLSSNGRFGTAMNFFVEGINNDIILRKDGLVLSGNITFGDMPDNELHILFSLSSLLPAFDPARSGVLPEFPVVELTGNPGIFLFSAEGLAELNFDDLNATVRNANDNAFVVDDNGLLRYKRLQILDNPIKQQSADFRFEGIELLGQRIDPGFIRSPRLLSGNLLITAMHIMRQREKDLFAQSQKHAQASPKKPAHSLHKPASGKLGKKKPHPHAKYRDIIDLTQLPDEQSDSGLLRALSLPESFDQSYVDQVLNPVTPISGNIQYTRTVVNNFIVDPELPFNILIQEGSTITLGADVVLNETQKINVKGLGNVINMPFGMTIGPNNLFLDQNAEVTFQFTPNVPTPELIILDNTVLDIEPDAILRLSGTGITTLGDGVVVNFKGVKTVHPVTKVETVSSRGYFIITEDATLRLDERALARMKGVGEVEVSNRGKILLDGPGTLVFGVDEPTVFVFVNNVDPIFPSENFNDIIFNVFDDGEVIIQPGADANRAFVSFRYLTSVIKFENGGFLFIDDNGTFQINARRLTPNPSRLNELSFRAGLLNVRGSGIFAMGSNKINLGTGQPYPFKYSGISSLIEGTGKARFIAPGSAGFEGFINPTPAARDQIEAHTAVNLIRSLIGLEFI